MVAIKLKLILKQKLLSRFGLVCMPLYSGGWMRDHQNETFLVWVRWTEASIIDAKDLLEPVLGKPVNVSYQISAWH